VLIESPDMPPDTGALRYDRQPANCYIPTLISQEVLATPIPRLRTQEHGKMIKAASALGDLLRGVSAELLTLLPIDELL